MDRTVQKMLKLKKENMKKTERKQKLKVKNDPKIIFHISKKTKFSQRENEFGDWSRVADMLFACH